MRPSVVVDVVVVEQPEAQALPEEEVALQLLVARVFHALVQALVVEIPTANPVSPRLIALA